jgi:serine/threonine protein kinase/tetratricopeptide (TPR) repeat protein
MNGGTDRDIAIFTEALQLPREEHDRYLDEACKGNAELRRRIEVLLEAYERAGNFLGTPAAGISRKGEQAPAVGDKPGDRIGRFKLLQKIGEGGCGVVYMAEQEEPVRRRVALKIIKPGMDTKSVIARFEAERQALALMDHPNIAKVFDAGATDSGRPYFVMELVRGVKITEYCDQHSLTTEERLKLFARVCQAIQHAHQRGIIHRDIKPSNILVTQSLEGVAMPMVIDFGVAKATMNQRLTDKTLFTAFEMLIGTPAYMSPEQAALSSVDVDTRTDIYSLGVLLYELLTSATPFQTEELLKAGLDEIRRVIREEEPPRPSTRLTKMADADLTTVAHHRQSEPPRLIHTIRGDLDWIAMKALEKDRRRRYQTANSLADDIHRYLGRETVSARPPSRLYQFQKLVSRHKPEFAALGIVMATLVAGLGITSWSLAKEKVARREANQQQNKAEIGGRKAITEAARSQQVTEFLKKMLAGVDPSVAVGRDTTVLREILDNTVERLGQELTNQPAVETDLKVTIGGVYGAIGDYNKAAALLRSALDFYRKSPAGAERKIADALSDLAMQHLMLSRFEEAEKECREALAIDPSLQVEETMRRVSVETRLGWVILRRDRFDEAERILRKALAMGQHLVGDDSEQLLDTRAGLATTLNNLDILPEAESLLRKNLAVGQKRYRPNHPYLANDMYRLVFVLQRENKLDEAEEFARQCIAIRRKVLGPDHPLFDQALQVMARLLTIEGKPKEAADVYRELLELRRKHQGDEHSLVAETVMWLGRNLVNSGNEVQFEQLARDFPKAWLTRSEDLAKRGRWSEALAAASKFVELRPDDHSGYHVVAPLLVQMGDRTAYEELCTKITARFAGATDPYTADRMAKDCLILPRPGADLKVPAELAEIAVTRGRGDAGALPFFQCCKALAEYRQGHWDTASDWAQRASAISSKYALAEACAVMGMAQFQMKQMEACRANLKKCDEVIQTQLSGRKDGEPEQDWRDMIIARALLSEAEQLIDGEPSAANPTSLPQ